MSSYAEEEARLVLNSGDDKLKPSVLLFMQARVKVMSQFQGFFVINS